MGTMVNGRHNEACAALLCFCTVQYITYWIAAFSLVRFLPFPNKWFFDSDAAKNEEEEKFPLSIYAILVPRPHHIPRLRQPFKFHGQNPSAIPGGLQPPAEFFSLIPSP